MELEQNLPDDFKDAVVALPLVNSPEICLVNFSDYVKCIKYNWYLRIGAVSAQILGRRISLSRFIAGKNYDHKDRNILNNCKCNLRKATKLQQNLNKNKIKRNCSSIYKGVYKYRGKWCARVCLSNKRIFLGMFDSEIEAAKAYDLKARDLHKEFAGLNFPNT